MQVGGKLGGLLYIDLSKDGAPFEVPPIPSSNLLRSL